MKVNNVLCSLALPTSPISCPTLSFKLSRFTLVSLRSPTHLLFPPAWGLCIISLSALMVLYLSFD